ncbi:hypothetical protein APA_5330 [Pseudanabaena sp. lw0831]|nr:hypothetical protein APA_5330 [Pseudanabaena sp. lw0831]
MAAPLCVLVLLVGLFPRLRRGNKLLPEKRTRNHYLIDRDLMDYQKIGLLKS